MVIHLKIFWNFKDGHPFESIYSKQPTNQKCITVIKQQSLYSKSSGKLQFLLLPTYTNLYFNDKSLMPVLVISIPCH